MTPTRVALALLLLIVVLGVAAVLRPDAVEVETALVRRAPMRVTVDEEGRTRVRDRYVVTAPVSGRLQRLPLTEGDVVRAGDVVAHLAPVPLDEPAARQASARVAAARAMARAAETRARAADAAFEQTRRDTERVRQLFAAGALSRSEMERAELMLQTRADDEATARAQVAAALAEVEQATASLLHTGGGREGVLLVRAPASGRVLRLAERSERVVAPGSMVAEIGDTRVLEVVVDVLSSDAARICAGMEVQLEGWGGGEPLEGRVRLVEPAATTHVSALGVEEQRVNVIVQVAEPPAALGDGYRVDARIVVWEADDALTVPASALVRVGTGWGTYVVEAGRARLRPVVVGQMGGADVQVERGLAEGAQVVLFPSDQIHEGVRVTARSG